MSFSAPQPIFNENSDASLKRENYLATRFQNYITYVTEEYTDLIRHVVVLTVH
jgi:hypothetical protein